MYDLSFRVAYQDGNPSRKTSENSSLIQLGVVVLLGSSAVFAVARYNSVIWFFRISALSRLREIIEILGVSSLSLTRGNSMSSRMTMPFSG